MKSLKTLQLAICLLVFNTAFAFGQGDSKVLTIFTNEINKAEEITTEATQEIRTHILENLKYPQVMQDFDIQGISEVSISLDKEGNIISKTITKSLGKAFDEAILSSLKNMLKSSPVFINGEASSYAIVVPVQFQM